jgi:hypothetical protein
LFELSKETIKLSKKVVVTERVVDTQDGGQENKRLNTDWLFKKRCSAKEMDDHGNVTEERCDTFSAIGTDYCWWHLRHIFGLILRQTDATQDDGRKYPELGVFAYYSTELDEQKGEIPNDQRPEDIENVTPDESNVADEYEPVTSRVVFKRGQLIIPYPMEKFDANDAQDKDRFEQRYKELHDNGGLSKWIPPVDPGQDAYDNLLLRSTAAMIQPGMGAYNVFVDRVRRNGTVIYAVFALRDIYEGEELRLEKQPMSLPNYEKARVL